MTAPRALHLRLAAAVAVVALAGVLVGLLATWTADSRIFFPAPEDPTAQVVQEQMQAGAGARTVLIGVTGAPADALATASRRLVARLRQSGRFRLVANGMFRPDQPTLDWLFRHRYLLNPAVDPKSFEPEQLEVALRLVRRELASSAGLARPDLLFADPTGRLRKVLAALTPAGRARGTGDGRGVWMTADQKTAVLVARLPATGPDAATAEALTEIRKGVAALQSAQGAGTSKAQQLRLLLSGPAVIAETIRGRIRAEAVWLSGAATAFVLLMLVLVFRRPTPILAATTVVLAGVIAGIAAVQLIFGQVHGITVTFGAMLIGLAIDYPLHILVHRRTGATARESARHLSPTLFVSAATTIAAFLPLVLSSFPGLAQLGTVSAVGLCVAALAARFMLPVLVADPRVHPPPVTLPGWRRRRRGLAAVLGVAAAAGVGGAVIGLAQGRALWERDISRLSPLSAEQLRVDRHLRSALPTINPRYVIVMRGDTPEPVLRKSEGLAAALAGLVRAGRLGGFDAPGNILPSRAMQKARQAKLPDPAQAKERLATAAKATGFAPDAFDTAAAAIAGAKTAGGLATRKSLRGTLLQDRLDGLLFPRGAGWVGLVWLRDPVPDARAVGAAIRATGGEVGARLLDLKALAASLVAAWRDEALIWLAAGAILSLLILALALRRPRPVLQIAGPVAAALALTLLGAYAVGIPLSFFHLLSLMIVAGLGFDYAVFMQRHAGDPEAGSRVLQSVTICALSTIGVYSILALSSVPLLRSIGMTTATGAALVFLFVTLFAIWRREPGSAGAA